MFYPFHSFYVCIFHFIDQNYIREKVLLMLTDAGAPMIKMGDDISRRGLYPKMVHLLCSAHALHNVSCTIRKLYPRVDLLIMGFKKLFKLSHSRMKMFKEISGGIRDHLF